MSITRACAFAITAYFTMVAAGCAGRTFIEMEERRTDECEPGIYSQQGFWVSGDGDVAKLPNFVAPADGGQWVFPIETPLPGRVEAIDVVVSQVKDPPKTSANLGMSRYDNDMGWGTVGPSVNDVPSTEKHPLELVGVDSIDFDPIETVRIVLQAPYADDAQKGALWIWSVPRLHVSCD
jgi:hypothetical protein